MPPSFKIISMGTLTSNHLWNEAKESRVGHATTTLIKSSNNLIVVNPGLPLKILTSRMHERTSIKSSDVTHVFLTHISTDHMRGIAAFPNAIRYAFDTELEMKIEEIQNNKSVYVEKDELIQADKDLELLKSFKSAPDSIAPGVDLFPTPGVSLGHCSLLIGGVKTTILAGDAIASEEHFWSRNILPTVINRERALESFNEISEIADQIITGRGNWISTT